MGFGRRCLMKTMPSWALCGSDEGNGFLGRGSVTSTMKMIELMVGVGLMASKSGCCLAAGGCLARSLRRGPVRGSVGF